MKNLDHFLSKVTVVVAIPARDEEERIGACLSALANQSVLPDHIVLQLNNCIDQTAAAARSVVLSRHTALHLRECVLPPHLASAGHARGLAMTAGASIGGRNGVLLTTDADGRVDHEWIACNLRALAAGADAVAGWAEIDPDEAVLIPRSLHEDDARECAYDALCDEIDWLIDPNPDDPWPRHTQHSGASIAVTAAAFHRAGGIPAVASGEDRAFFTALRRVDARVRHSLDCHVLVSGRTLGRAAGGMADTIRRRIIRPDLTIDDRLEPVADWVRRIELRRLCREVFRGSASIAALAAAAELDGTRVLAAMQARFFGLAWSKIEIASPVLRRRLVAVADLATETARAAAIRNRLLAPELDIAAD